MVFMKRTILLFFLVGIFTNNALAQLYVDNNGNVGVKVEDGSVNSAFSIMHPGYSEDCANINADSSIYDTGLRIAKYGTPETNSDYTSGVRIYTRGETTSTRKIYGILSHTHKTSGIDTNRGRSYGIYALAGNSSTGWNYGVFGTLYGNNNGAGVFGSSESWDGGISTGDRYAGFFHGKVKVTNSIEATAFNLSSDYRLKENIKSLDSESMENIMKLNVVSYNIKQRIVDTGDTATASISYYTEDSNLLQKTHYGLIAQELQDVYPDLVYEGGDGYLSVNYVELIPILIQSIQSLKKEVDQLKENKKTSKRITTSTTNIEKELSSIQKISISDLSITITCAVSSSVKEANMIIYAPNGTQIYSNVIKERGQIEIEIKDLTLYEGIFVCSLLTDDDIDSRRFYFGN